MNSPSRLTTAIRPQAVGASPFGGNAARLGAAAIVLGSIGVSIAFVDRPAATWAHAAFHNHRNWFDPLTHLIDPLLPLASGGLAIAALAAGFGYRPGRAAKVLVACGLAVILVVTLKDQAKYAFGRLWPETWVDNNPSWIDSAAYGFSPFHGGRGWASFPSGHMAVASAPACVVWRTVRRLRIVVCIAVALVAVGLLGSDYHFVSDVVAGTTLGVLVGYATVAVVELGWRLA